MDDVSPPAAPNGSVPGFRVFGSEESASSDKLRLYLRYKEAPFTWIARTAYSEEELHSLARFRTLPVLVTPSGHAAHGTRQMISALEADLADNPVAPASGSALAVLAAILEDYADSWLIKGVMHYRWRCGKDAKLAAQRAVDGYFLRGQDENGLPVDRDEHAKVAVARMDKELVAVGLDAEISTGIETSFRRAVRLLDVPLRHRAFLLGERPCTADFAVAAQFRQALKDPTTCQIINKTAPNLKKWASQTVDGNVQAEGEEYVRAGGEYGAFSEIAEDMRDFFKKELCSAFLPWAQANLHAWRQEQDQFEVKIGRKIVHTRCIRSAAKSFQTTLGAVGECQDAEAREFLESVGALAYMS